MAGDVIECVTCNGHGEMDASGFPCIACKGKGYFPKGISMNYSIDLDGPGEREGKPKRKHQTIHDVIADMENCAEQYHNGLRLKPETMGYVFDMLTYELSFYAKAHDDMLSLIGDLAASLTDEGPDWSQDGLNSLRQRTADAFSEGECPDWLAEYRSPN